VTRVATLFIYSSIIGIVIISGFSAPLSAQSGSVRLEGIVWEPSGNSLAGAVLTAVEDSTGREARAVSNSDGEYVFLALQPGTYTVTVKAKGFKDVIHRSISLFPPGSISQDFSFEVSAIDKEIAPSEFLRLKESQNSSSFTKKEIEILPLLDRNPLSLLVYQPGVQIRTEAPGSSTVNGTRPGMNNTGMDGFSVTDPVQPQLDLSIVYVNPDTISDIQMVTIGAKAEYGRSGGGQFMLVSRPGAKSWSGSLYDYFRNQNLDANDFFYNAAKLERPQITRNIFGATLSGPAFSDKTLLFFNFEGTRTDQEVPRNRLVLTPEAKTGLFRWYTPDTNLRDNIADTPKSFDIVANDPRHLGIDPSVASILATVPNPNNAVVGDRLNTGGYSFDNPAYFNQEGISARLDHYLNPNHQLFFRVNWNHVDSTDLLNRADAPFPGEESGKLKENDWGFAVGSDWTLSPQLVNELRIGYFRPSTDLERPARLSSPMYIFNLFTTPLDTSFPRSYKSPVFDISDFLSHARGTHTFKFGGGFRRTVLSSEDYSGVYANVTFGLEHGNAPSASIGPTGVSVISADDRNVFEYLYNDLLGRMEGVNQMAYSSLSSVLPAGTPRNRDYTLKEFAGFIQDDWRILPNLTLNLGLRYEVSSSPSEQNGYQDVPDQNSEISGSANISNFQFVAKDSWHSTALTNFGPRAGFAWDPFNTGSLVIRGSYGIYYDRLIGAVTNFVDANSYGFSQDISQHPNSTSTDRRLSDGVPIPGQPSVPPTPQPSATRTSSVAILDPDLRTPRVDQFHVTLEKRLWGAILEAGYVGTRGKNLFQYLNLNQTKTNGDFLQAFEELSDYRENGTPVPASNTLIRIFGSPIAAMNALGGSNFDTGQAGIAADILDRDYYQKYAAAGVSDFYIRNYPQFNTFMYGSSSAESWYDALQAGVRKSTRYSNLRAYYTWSKSLDTMSAEGSSYVSPSDSRFPEMDKAPSDFNRTHVFTLAGNYALPFGRERSTDPSSYKLLRAFFGGWNVGTLVVWESGQHFSVNSGRENLYAGVESLANLEGSRDVGALTQINGVIYWFNPDQAKLFTYPDAGEIPNSGRNSFSGPSYFNLDVMLQKKFWLGEKKSIQFRIEAYNIFNNTRFAIPGTNLDSDDFGIITSTVGNPRRMQLALRFQF